jgi:hypothetical protein
VLFVLLQLERALRVALRASLVLDPRRLLLQSNAQTFDRRQIDGAVSTAATTATFTWASCKFPAEVRMLRLFFNSGTPAV